MPRTPNPAQPPPMAPHDHLGNAMPGKWPGQGQ